MRMKNKKRIAFGLGVAGLIFWGFLLYAQTLNAPFIFDDDEFVLRNPAVRYLGDSSLWRDLNYRKRIVAFLTFALNYRFHGVDAAGYHAANILIHLFAGLSLVWLVLLLFRTPRMRDEPEGRHRQAIALLCGLLFVSHPVQTEAVAYISQRFECLAAFFYLLGACFYLKARTAAVSRAGKGVLFVASGLSVFLGALTKETVFTFPAALILVEWVFFRPPTCGTNTAKEETRSLTRWIYIGGIFLGLAATLPLLLPNFFRLFTEHAKAGMPWDLYALTQFRVIVRYFVLLLLPVRQNLDHDVALSPGLFDGPTLGSAVFVLAVLLLGIKLVRRHPLAGFGILWFFLTLSVSSSFMPLKDLMFEHRLYLPLAGFSIALLGGIAGAVPNFRFFARGALAFILLLSFLTYQRNKVWTDEAALWEDAVAQSPLKARPHANLGRAYRNKGEYGKAVEYYLKAIALHRGDPRHASLVYTNLGAVYGKMKKYSSEVDACLRAIELNPKNAQAYSNLGFAYAALGDYGNALRYGGQAVRMAPRFDEGWINLGVTFGRMRHYERAVAHFQKALELNPYSQEAKANLNLTLLLMTERPSGATFSTSTFEASPEQRAGGPALSQAS